MTKNSLLLWLLLLLTAPVGADPMQKAKTDVEKVMNAMLPFAQQMLEKHGEFFPYGAVMTPTGEVVSIGGYDGREQPPSQDIINLLKESFRAAVKAKKYKATGIFFDVRTVPPGSTEKTDAVAIALDHEDNYSVVVYFPYKLKSGKVQFDPVFATAGANDIFGK
jgi:hypothetical protein